MKTRLLAAALVATAGLAGAAAAGPLDVRPGDPGGHGPVKVLVIVSSRGLDLGSDAGADRFLGRLGAAITAACDDRSYGPPLTVSHSAEFQTCRDQALQEAMTYVRSPLVKRRFAVAQLKNTLRLARR